MNTIIPQSGNNVASQIVKPSAMPAFERIDKADASDAAKSQNAKANDNVDSNIEQNIAAKIAQSAQAIASEADSDQREGSAIELNQALLDISEFLQSRNTKLAFSVDEASDRPVVTVKDAASGDVIRQIPSEEVLKFAGRINELQSEFGSSVGILLKGQA
ncbi:MAG: flagellar protein FlaG [Glaciecola sp.]|jgi:flagellar protein FlaG